MNKIYPLFLLITLIATGTTKANISTVTLSATTATDCDTVIVTMQGTHTCPNDFITGVTHTVSGSMITVNVSVLTGICIPPLPPPTFTRTYSLPLGALGIGGYTVRANYNSFTSASTSPLTVTSCCPSQAIANNDTSICNTSSLAIQGNTPPASAAASWTVITGTGTLVSSSQPSTTINNLSFGLNEVVWTIVDTSCTTSDTVRITNFEMPTMAVTESDKRICDDTTTINATPVTVGSGSWGSSMPGILISNRTMASTPVSFSGPGTYELYWTTTNGRCQTTDTLEVSYVALSSAPTISATGLELSSTPVPQYQWYKDGAMIPGATNSTYTVTANGVYQVLGSEAGCSTGLFSNEIEFSTVGIEEKLLENNYIIAPNPSSGEFQISGLNGFNEITLYQLNGKRVSSRSVNQNQITLDYSNIESGVYLLEIRNERSVIQKKLVLTD